MIDYLMDIKPLQDEGVSNATIAAHLSARTAIGMSTESTRTTLQETGTVLTDPVMVNQRSGTLIDFYQTLPAGDNQTLIAWFLSEVFSMTAVAISTNQYPRSLQFASVEAALPVEIQVVSEQLVAASGGRLDAGITEAQVVEIQTTWEEAEALRELVEAQENKYVTLYNQNIAPLIDANNPDDAAWQAALTNMATEWGN
tara:strand:+ start:198 stop:794 length:597 start_codon:yes stop_codon:yes gene_type:complete